MKQDITKKEILNSIKSEKDFLYREFGVVNIGLFGSYVKGTQSSNSDIDILVELKEPRFDWMAGLQIHLENKLGRRIELVRKQQKQESRFLKRIQKDIIYA